MTYMFILLQALVATDISALMQAEAEAVSSAPEAQELLGARTTEFRVWGRYRNRARNIRRASAAINGITIAPGATFSFNDVVGPRTLRRGYRHAPAILRGELGESVGGGVCQVASTIFAAAMEAGMDFIEATPHSRHMHYIEPGFDATVFYDSKDFSFRNPYSFPITLNVTTHDNNQLTAEFYGAQRVYKVEISFVEVHFERRDTVRRHNARLPEGRCRVMERGTDEIRLLRTVRFFPLVPGYDERIWLDEMWYDSTDRVLECNR